MVNENWTHDLKNSIFILSISVYVFKKIESFTNCFGQHKVFPSNRPTNLPSLVDPPDQKAMHESNFPIKIPKSPYAVPQLDFTA